MYPNIALIDKILNTDEEKTTYVGETNNHCLHHGQFQAKDSELQCQQTQNWHMEGTQYS